MDIRKVKKLIELLEESGIAEIEISEGEESVRISRHPTGPCAPARRHGLPPPGAARPGRPAPAARGHAAAGNAARRAAGPQGDCADGRHVLRVGGPGRRSRS